MALQGFVEAEYLAAKLAALQAVETEWVGKDAAFLTTVLTNHGLTAEQHYQQYGYKEGLAPNDLFNAAEYKLAKATDMFNKGGYFSIEAAQTAFDAAWTGDAYEHYLAYGSAEGINPSNAFDESSYLASKLAALQTADPTNWPATKTVADVSAALAAAGFSALGHYQAYGKLRASLLQLFPLLSRLLQMDQLVLQVLLIRLQIVLLQVCLTTSLVRLIMIHLMPVPITHW